MSRVPVTPLPRNVSAPAGSRWHRLGVPGRLAVTALVVVATGLSPLSAQFERWQARACRAATAGEFETARSALGALFALADQTAPALYDRLAALTLAAGEPFDAEVYLLSAAHAAGWSSQRREMLRRIELALGRGERAQALAASDVPRESAGSTGRFSVEQLIAQRDWTGAAAAVRRGLQQAPDDPELNFWQGVLLGAGDPRAHDHLRQAAESEQYHARAQAALDALQQDTAARLADRWTALGVALVGVEEWALAWYALDQALAADPLHPAALAYRGYVKDQQGQDGLADIQAAQTIAPRDPTAYYFAGLHWRLAGDQDAARQAFMDGYWLAPQNPALAAEVAGSFEMQGDYAQAESWYRLALDLAPADASWYALVARFYAETGFRLDDGGLAFVQEAAERFPGDPDIAASYGWALYQAGDTDDAYAAISKAVSRAPESVRARYYFGVILESRGDPAAAADSYWYVVDTAARDDFYRVRAARALQRLGMQQAGAP